MLSNDDLLTASTTPMKERDCRLPRRADHRGDHRMDELLTRVDNGSVDPDEQILIQVLGDG
jgi:hypothetical protein